MASSPITSRQIEGAKVKAVTDFIFLGSKVTADGDCSCEIERRLLLGRKGKPGQQVKRQRHHFAHKGPQSQCYGFSSSCVQMWELDHTEDWALKNWCFWIVVLEKTPENPLDFKENKPVNPKGDQPWIFIEGLMLQYFGHLIQRADYWKRPWCWERLKAGGEGGNREWDGWMAPPTRWTWVWANSGRKCRTEEPGVLQSMGSQRVGHNWVMAQQQLLL